MQTAPSKARRDRRADVGSSGPVKLMKIAAAKPGGDGGSAGVETSRRMNAGCAKLTKPWTSTDGRRAGIDGVSRLGMRNDDAVVMMAPGLRANDWGDGAAPKTVAPFIAARIIARAVRPIFVPAIAAILDSLHGR
jgi:hypothetical protein